MAAKVALILFGLIDTRQLIAAGEDRVGSSASVRPPLRIALLVHPVCDVVVGRVAGNQFDHELPQLGNVMSGQGAVHAG